MRRAAAATAFTLLAVSVAHGHFPFIVAEPDGQSAKVVFSDTLDPDTSVKIEKLDNTKLTLRVAGKESPLEWKKGDGFYSLNVPGAGNRVVYGTTLYGVLQKGDSKPFKLVYFPKAVIGDATAKDATIGESLPLEIAAVGGPGQVKFCVLAAGKPLPDAAVTVLLPGGGKKSVTTGADGCTPVFEESGRYGVYARKFEATAGEYAGLKYDEVRYYATLVCDIK